MQMNMGQLIDGKFIAEKIRLDVAKKTKQLKRQGINPKLGVILVGDHKPSLTYIRKKQEAAEQAGIGFVLNKYPTNISKTALISEIKKFQTKEKLSGLIIQLPLPERLYAPEILNSVCPDIDVDCLNEENIGKLVMKTNFIYPPTPLAAITVLDYLKIDTAGKNITIIGTGALVGKPLAIIFANKGATVTTCNSKTKNLKEKCLTADIIITGVGKKDILRGDMVGKGAVVIDTGISYENRKMYGDANREEVLKKAAFLTPTPGGIGPITVSLLLQNTITCAQRNNKNHENICCNTNI
jgi:methylenetetrahydrofolate dehydrogenase (NADP+)/methenyltetrahydrofolate cyclohydrolase